MINKYPTIDDEFVSNLIAEFKAEELQHIPSGKLSASALPKPTLWQVLHYLQVPSKEDDFKFPRFQRGRDIESTFVKRLHNVEETQKEVSFNNCVGFVDATYKTQQLGILPLEIKSVTSWKFKHIKIEKVPDDQYQLQATLYALALKTSKALISVVNADDLHSISFMIDTEDLHREVIRIIEQYDNAINNRVMPIFVPRYKWQENYKWSDYPDFDTLNQQKILEKLKIEYPASYERWAKKT